jgi:DNA polymerase-3 subunit gamma/tau
VANGAPVMVAAPAPAAAPSLASFRDVVALVAERREPTLHGFLRHAVHLVRFAPGIIELRPEPDAPRDLAPRLAALLLEATGQRWTIALSKATGEPTIAAQGEAADTARRSEAVDHPLVRAILEAFPGAVIAAVHDHTADAYGLAPEAPVALGEPEGFEIPLPDADPADMMEYDP